MAALEGLVHSACRGILARGFRLQLLHPHHQHQSSPPSTTITDHHHHPFPTSITTTDGDAPHIFAMPRHPVGSRPRTKRAEVVLNLGIAPKWVVNTYPGVVMQDRSFIYPRRVPMGTSAYAITRICVRRSKTTPSAWGDTYALLDAHCLKDPTSDTSGRTLASDLNAIAAACDCGHRLMSTFEMTNDSPASTTFAPTHSDPVHGHAPSRPVTPRSPSPSLYLPCLRPLNPYCKAPRHRARME